MPSRAIIILFLTVSIFQAVAQQYRKIPNDKFRRGEKLEFRVAFHSALTGNIQAGKATLEIVPSAKQFDGRSTYHAVLNGRTTGFIEFFYRVEERFESFFDEEALIPYYFLRRTRENNYVKNDNVTFRHKDKLAVSLSSVTKVPDNIQDIVSAFYYARTLNIDTNQPGKVFDVPFFLDDSVYQSRVRFEGRETVKTKLGKFKCLVIKPMVATGYVFEDPYPVTIYISDDNNRIPILIQSELAVGSARIELLSYEGLANPMDALVKK